MLAFSRVRGVCMRVWICLFPAFACGGAAQTPQSAIHLR